jgi:hypothetical protein
MPAGTEQLVERAMRPAGYADLMVKGHTSSDWAREPRSRSAAAPGRTLDPRR